MDPEKLTVKELKEEIKKLGGTLPKKGTGTNGSVLKQDLIDAYLSLKGKSSSKKPSPKKPSPKKIPTFIELAKAYQKDNFQTKLDELIDENRFSEQGDDEEDAIFGMLPKAKLILDNTKINVVYHGKENEINSVRLYLYGDYYIISRFSNEGDDIDVWTFDEYDGLLNFYKTEVRIVDKESVIIDDLVKNNTNISDLILTYKRVYGPNAKKKLLARIDREWDLV